MERVTWDGRGAPTGEPQPEAVPVDGAATVDANSKETRMSDTETQRGVLSRLVPSTVRRSYTLKFVVSILLIVVVIAAAGAVGFVQARDTVETDTRESLAATATVQASELGEFLRDKRGRAGQVATESTLLTGETAAVNRLLTDRETQFGSEVTQIHVVDLQAGTVEASTNPRIRGTGLDEGTVADRPWADADRLASLPAGQSQLTQRAYRVSAADSQEYRMAAVVKVRGGDRAVVVVGNLGEVLTDLSRPETGQGVALVNAEGETALAGVETGDGFALGSAGGTDAGETAGTVPGGAVSMSEGEDPRFRSASGRVYAIAPVAAGGTTWAAVTSVPQTEAFAVVNAVGTTIGGIVVLALGALAVFAIVIGRQTVTPLSALRGKVERMEEGDLDVDLSSSREDEIGRLYGGFASMRDSLRDRIAEIEATNRRLERRAESYSEVMRACAAGDLTRRMDPDSDNESMAAIAREFNQMVAELETTTRDIKQFADEVAISSQEVTASADLVRDASEEVSDSVREINQDADQQSERLSRIAEEMDDLSARVDEVAAASDEVAAVATRTVETGREGRAAAESAVEAMDRVTDESAAAVDQMEKLEEETEQIDDLLEFINEIAQRTNMLALNANIEANREPEAGEESGFGVIANEIKDLSEEAQEATEDVARRLRRIQERTGEAAGVVERTSREVEESAENVEAAVRALDEIVTYAEETNEGVQEVSEANADQVESTTAVADQVDAVAEISERTSESSERVARLADDQSGATARMSDSAGDLNRRAIELSESLDDFETGPVEGGDDAAGAGQSPPEAAADAGSGEGFDLEAAGGDDATSGGGEDDPHAPEGGDPTPPSDGQTATAGFDPSNAGDAGGDDAASFTPGSDGSEDAASFTPGSDGSEDATSFTPGDESGASTSTGFESPTTESSTAEEGEDGAGSDDEGATFSFDR
jgi:methyl-accepting chemotaxis protein